MRTIREIESEMWELGKKMNELETELNAVLEHQREKIRSCLNEDGSWDIEKMKELNIL